ncbi:MAG: xylose transport system permease protein XylH [Actinomycetia bacterium]|nr:xylose transport system permease protein XylH [Actinomycetes bacterium]
MTTSVGGHEGTGNPLDEPSGVEPDIEAILPPDIAANSLPEYVKAWTLRIRAGDTGLLPVIVGLFLIAAIFQFLNSKFLSAGNLVNLLVQGSIYMLLAMAEVYVLLLGEIDLSAGFVAGVSGVITAELLTSQHGSWPWYFACLAALAACAVIGAFQGSLITRIGLPSFVVTLAGLLGFQGVMLLILGNGGTLPIQDNTINNFANGNLSPGASWVVVAALVIAYGALLWFRDARRRKSGLVAPPASVTLVKIGFTAIAGIVLVLICNTNRGVLVPIKGMPWVVLIVVGVLVLWTILTGRTKFGRYIYAIGGNVEAARRAGVRVARVRTLCFALCSLTAGIAGIIYASRLRSVSTNLDGGTLVLYAVAAAVIGGTSLFGGRGKMVHAVVGGVVIAAIDNGMSLQGFSAASKFIVTAIVLLVAVTIDAVARRGATAA